jgi:hypothetical protein
MRKMKFRDLRSGIRRRGPRLARRHPNGESEGILDGPTLMVRPDLRRDMVGVPEISGPQEREREREREMWSTQRERLLHGGPQSLVGNPIPRDKSEPRPSARMSRKRERSQLCVREGLPRERTLREDWPVVDGSWGCSGVEELPGEL